MRRHACAITIILATIVAVQGQLILQEEVDALVKDVNQLVPVNKLRTARQQGYDYSKPTSSLQIPSRVLEEQRPHEEHHEEHHHDDHHGAHSHIHVTRLDVTCDARGMSVELEFSGAFNGIVYSKGHYKNRNCRFVNKESARGEFNFLVPMDDCGTVGDDKREEHETILIIQNEESVQEIWDSAKRVRCPTQSATSRKKITKTVSFNPFTVQRLVIDEPEAERAVEETKIECWMDILVGKGPCGSTVQDKVKIGEQLNAMIYIKDGGANYDILVKDCYAHDSENLNAPDGSSVHLSDDRGCPKKEKLMGLFQKTEQTCSSGADLVAFAPISAFKFADRPDVFLTCVVELCPGGCDQCPASSNNNTVIVRPPTTPRTPNPRTPPPTQPPTARTQPPTQPPTQRTQPPTQRTQPPTQRVTQRTQPPTQRTPPPTQPPTRRTQPPTQRTQPPPTQGTPPPSQRYTEPPVQCAPPLRGRYPNCKPAHCEFNPSGPGCGITEEELNNHPFHIRNAGAVKPRKRITGARPSSVPHAHSRRRRDTSKNIVITGVGTGFHFQ